MIILIGHCTNILCLNASPPKRSPTDISLQPLMFQAKRLMVQSRCLSAMYSKSHRRKTPKCTCPGLVWKYLLCHKSKYWGAKACPNKYGPWCNMYTHRSIDKCCRYDYTRTSLVKILACQGSNWERQWSNRHPRFLEPRRPQEYQLPQMCDAMELQSEHAIADHHFA